MAKPDDGNLESHRLIEAAVAAWSAERQTGASEHPDTDTLIASQEGHLEGRVAEAVRRHLVDCPTCRREYLLLQEFDEESLGDAQVFPTAAETENSWQRFQTQRAAGRPGARRPTGSESPVLAQPRGMWPLWAVAAAVLVALAAGGMLTVIFGEGEVDKDVVLAGSVVILDLDPAGSILTRSAEGSQWRQVPKDTEVLVLRLLTTDLTRYDAYQVELITEERLWDRFQNLRRSDKGEVAIAVPRATWPGGIVHLRLLAESANRWQEIATYEVELRFDS